MNDFVHEICTIINRFETDEFPSMRPVSLMDQDQGECHSENVLTSSGDHKT